jgi:hypothetical protein
MDADAAARRASAIEPPLADLLGDPVLHAMLRSDGLSLDELRAAIAAARASLAGTRQGGV